jgi:hypothetical protein
VFVSLATSDSDLVAATIALAGTTMLVAVPAAWSALLSARQMKRNLLPIITPARPDGSKRVARFTPAKHVVLENADSFSQEDGERVYLAVCVRNIGSGVAVVRGVDANSTDEVKELAPDGIPALRGLVRSERSLYLGPTEAAYLTMWATSSSSAGFDVVRRTVPAKGDLLLDLVYCDHAGRQLTVSRIELRWASDANRYVARLVKYWRPRALNRRKVARCIKRATPTI